MSDLVRRAPFSVFIPTRKLLNYELNLDPNFLQAGTKKGTHPVYVLVNWDVLPEGVRLTVDPWAWSVAVRTYWLTDMRQLHAIWEDEREQAARVAMEEAQRRVWEEFPSFRRWRLIRELADNLK